MALHRGGQGDADTFQVALYMLCGTILYAFGRSMYKPSRGLYTFGALWDSGMKGPTGNDEGGA